MDSKGATFEAFVAPHYERLATLARQYVRTPSDSNDLMQETLLRAWRSFSSTQTCVYQRAWLVVIMRNVAAEWHRSSQRRIRLAPLFNTDLTDVAGPASSEPFAPLPTMDESQFREFLDDRVAAALDTLEPPYREVVVLSVAGGLNYREIGDVLECPIGTVMSRMARARRALREQLADYAATQSQERGGH
ncbi:MAG: RNA polymerase sigma factor [Planctomycetia bacterium]|nr:MAG: RNA polymerase sigma factor [Planctomycetia bacterium]RIK66975.1 MAG: hypothetical protein DCC66_12275 [Planctomycetota bacterium]